MNALDRLNKLADKLERKINKFAEEADSTIVTLTVRPIINSILDAEAPKLLMSIVGPILQKKGGKVAVGGTFYTNATKVGGNWKIDPMKSKLSSIPSGDKEVDAALARVVSTLMGKIVLALQAEFAKKSSMIPGDSITNHETSVNSKDLDVTPGE